MLVRLRNGRKETGTPKERPSNRREVESRKAQRRAVRLLPVLPGAGGSRRRIVKKILIVLAALALCSAAIASSGPLFTNALRTGLQFVSSQKGGGHGSTSSATGFTSATTGINSNGWLYVTFKDNVGSSSAGDTFQYTFTSPGAATWVCETGGKGKGKNQASAQQTTYFPNGSYTAYATGTASKRGIVSSSAVIPPPNAPAATSCSGTWELGAVAYKLPSNSLVNITAGDYNADSVMTGTCTIGTQCSDTFIGGVSAPAVQ